LRQALRVREKKTSKISDIKTELRKVKDINRKHLASISQEF
jgi:hypothetical protein